MHMNGNIQLGCFAGTTARQNETVHECDVGRVNYLTVFLFLKKIFLLFSLHRNYCPHTVPRVNCMVRSLSLLFFFFLTFLLVFMSLLVAN